MSHRHQGSFENRSATFETSTFSGTSIFLYRIDLHLGFSINGKVNHLCLNIFLHFVYKCVEVIFILYALKLYYNHQWGHLLF